jgi:uncharacterized protein YndB with AHSA1/START domain
MSAELKPSRLEDQAVDRGAVSLAFLVSASPAKVWHALTDPAAVKHWFGNLSAPLQEGGTAALDFTDGDFFTLEKIRLQPERRLQYVWSFLGIGPRDTVRWDLAPRGEDACVIRVTDVEQGRSLEAALLLQEAGRTSPVALSVSSQLARRLGTIGGENSMERSSCPAPVRPHGRSCFPRRSLIGCHWTPPLWRLARIWSSQGTGSMTGSALSTSNGRLLIASNSRSATPGG